MLGIALIILLGFFLYHYRPKTLEIETKFKQALHWSEWGKECFIGQNIFLIGSNYYQLFFLFLNGQLQSWMEYNNIFLYPFEFESITWYLQNYSYLFSLFTELFFYFFPIVFAWLIHRKLVKPLSEEKVPNQKWFHLIGLFCVMSIVGFFSIVFIQTLADGFYSTFGYGLMLHQLLVGLPFFSILFIGVLAVEIAGKKLKQSLTANRSVSN